MKFHTIKIKRLMACVVIVICILFLYSLIGSKSKKNKSQIDDSFVIISDSLENSLELLQNGKSIFFLETHNSSEHMLTARQACSIESAAYTNPNTNIVVLFLSPGGDIKLKNLKAFKSILKYENVYLRHFNMLELIKDTKIENWILNGNLERSWYKVVHTSDILRYTILSKFPTLYMDLDVIVKYPIEDLSVENFACYQDDGVEVNNAIMKFSGDDGREITNIFLKEIIENFNGLWWERNGPPLVTRSIKQFCNSSDLKKVKKCKSLEIFSSSKCYAIGFKEWWKLFRESHYDEAMEMIENSYFVHLWNGRSGDEFVEKSSRTAFNELAAEYCPQTYKINEYV